MNDYSSIFVILMGLGTVFFGLICLIALTTLMGRILSATPAAVPAAGRTATVPVAPAAAEPNRQERAAAVSAAIAEELGIDITGLRILSMRRL